MRADAELADHVQDLLSDWATVHARRMFGGIGLFREDCMFGLIFDGTLFLKADTEQRARLQCLGSEPFTYKRGDRTVALSYWRIPDTALDDAEELTECARWAWRAATQGRASSG